MPYATISAALSVGVKSARVSRSRVAVISAETHDGKYKGEYALCAAECTNREDQIMLIDENGDFSEGPAAMALPVGAE